MGNILEVRNLTKKRKLFTLNNISLDIKKGYIMGFIGENGAGKTTTIKLIMNLINKDSGSIKIFEKDNIANEKEVKEHIGFVYDECFYYDDLTIEENARMVSRFYKNWSNDDFNNYINRFNLNKKSKIKELSKGMKMKFSLAIALSHKAKLIILDEPTAGLDPVVRSEVLDILYDIIQDGETSVLISTHITSDLERIADYITYIKEGRVIFSKEKHEIIEEYKIVKGDKNDLTSEIKKSFIGLRESRFGFEALTKNETDIRRSLGDKIIVENVSLEDIMVFHKCGVK